MALGAKQINYYGYSYGTYLGQIYATKYPTRVRRMVLDGNVDSARHLVRLAARAGPVVREGHRAVLRLGGEARQDAYVLGKTAAAVRKKYNAELAKLRKTPVLGIGPAEWNDTFGHAGYAEFIWPSMASAFAARVHDGDMRAMAFQYQQSSDVGDDNGFAVYNAVQCTDAPWPRDYGKGWRADSFATAAEAPFMTWQNVWFNTACIYWAAPSGMPAKIDGKKAARNPADQRDRRRRDPVLRARCRSASCSRRPPLVAEKGATTHAGSLGGNKCVDDKVAAYLATGMLPKRKAGSGPDVVCARLPLPTPGPENFAEAAATPGSYGSASVEGSGSPSAPAPTPKPAIDQSILQGIIGLLPDRGGRY